MLNKSRILNVLFSVIFLSSMGFSQDFSATINAAGGSSEYGLTFGFNSNATDDYDTGYDQYAPPAPPPPAFDAALTWGGDRYYAQILAGDGNLSMHEYGIALSYGSDNLITITWDNTGWSDMMSSCVLQDAFGGVMFNVDMLTDNSLELTNPAFNTLKLLVTPNDYSTPADASISITSPMDGATMSDNDFSVSFDVENFSVGSGSDYDGHVHAFVDGSSNAYGSYMVYSTDPIELIGVPDGDHSIMLQLVDTSHNPFDPSIESSVNITVDTSVPNTAPEASFSWTADDLTVMFTNTSTDEDGDALSYSWDFGDGNSSTDESPTHMYGAAGSYAVSLTASDGELSDTSSDSVTVTDPVDPGEQPEFSVTINTAGGTSNYPLIIGVSPDATDGYDAGLDQYAPPAPPPPAFDAALGWGGDRYYTQILASNTDEREFDIQLAFPEDNLITISWDNTGWGALGDFQLTDAFGGLLGIDIDMLTDNSLELTNPAFNTLKLIMTPSTPVAGPDTDFSGSPTEGYSPLAVSFTDMSTQGDGAINNWSWDFGDGGTSSDQNPSHTYDTSGVYTVSLSVTDENGAADTEVKTDYITVMEPVVLTADFSGSPSVGMPPLEVSFSDLSMASTGYGISSWSWDFGDGGTTNDQNPIHTYDSLGMYTVSLTVTDDTGSSTETKENYINVVDIEPGDPEFAFTLNAMGGSYGTDLTFGFSASATDGYDENIDYYAPPAPPPPSFDAALGWGGDRYFAQILNGSVNDLVEHVFDILLQFDESNMVTISWDNTNWGILGSFQLTDAFDGALGIDVDMTSESSLSLDNPAINTLKLKVTPSGASMPSADFTADNTEGYPPLEVSFMDASEEGSSPIASYSWDFGDGDMSDEQNPTHLYANDGNYDVSLTVVDAAGLMDTETKEEFIMVIPFSGPDVDFTADITAGAPPLTVNFSDLSSTDPGYNLDSWSWDFGDGGMSTDQNPTYTYEEQGYFTVSLTVTDENGLSETEVKDEYISAIIEDLWPPANLQGTAVQHDGQVDVELEWDAPQDPNAIFINYDDGVNNDAIGLSAGGDWKYAARWDVNGIGGYDGMFLTTVYFFPRGVSTSFTLNVWKGANAGTLIHEQEVSPIYDTWNEIALDEVVMIDGSDELWIGFSMTQPADEYSAGCDAGPAVAGFGDMLTLDGVLWESMATSYGLNFNWNIQGLLSQEPGARDIASNSIILEPMNAPLTERTKDIPLKLGGLEIPENNTLAKQTRDFQYYNVYRDGEVIDIAYQEDYMDMALENGTYVYEVTAQYDGGESLPSNEAEVLVYFDPNQVGVSMYILLDNYPGETTWDLVDAGGNMIDSGGPYSEAGGVVEATWSLSVGDYIWTIYDSFGDGICCAYGVGFYELSMFGEVFADGGEFASEEAVPFTVESQIVGTIAGTASDGDGNPLDGVSVSIGGEEEAMTDSDGNYSFDIGIGIYTLNASKLGYNDDSESGVQVNEDETTTVNFTLDAIPTVSVSGNVTGFDAPDGLEGATIDLTGYADYEVMTDESGNFSVGGVYVNNGYHLKVSKPGYQTYNTDIDVGTDNVDVGTIDLPEYTEPLWPPENLTATVFQQVNVALAWDPPVDPSAIELAYDDGVAENYWYISDPIDETQHMAVGFTYPEDCVVNTGKFNMSFEGSVESFDWNLMGGSASGPDINSIWASGTTALNGDPAGSWYFGDFSSVEVSAGDWFYVDVQYRNGLAPGSNNYMCGGDASDIDPYSWYTIDGGNSWNNIGTLTDIMFRALISTEDGRSISLAPVISTPSPSATVGTVADMPGMPEEMLAKVTSVPYAEPQVISHLTRDLQGYNVYRDGEVIDFVGSPGYDDLNLEDGTYIYRVTAMYDGGESEPTDEVEVDIFFVPVDVVIIDLDPTPTGQALKSALENVYSGGVEIAYSLDEYSLPGMDAVFVLLGIFSNNTVIPVGSETPLTEYLDSGGNLYMEGSDMWYYDPQFQGAYDFGPLFGISAIADGSADLSQVNGYDFLEGMSWNYSGENNWIDQLSPVGNAVTIFANDQVGYDCGIANDAGNYRTVGTSFEITGLGGTNNLEDAVLGIVDFFGIGTPPGIVSGNVTLDGGSGDVTDVLVTVGNRTDNPNANGDYSIEIQGGVYDASAALFGYFTDTVEDVEVITEQTTTVDFTLNSMPTVSVSGQVVEFGSMTPLQGAVVELTGYAGYSGTTNSSGNFDISGVYSENTYNVEISYGILAPYNGMIDVGTDDYDMGVIELSEIVYPPSNLTGEVHNYNDVHLAWNSPTALEAMEISYDDGVLQNAFYFYGPYEDGFAHGTRFDVEGNYNIVAVSGKILSEGDEYWPWPNGTHGPVRVMVFDDQGGQPGNMLADEEVVAEDGWATIDVGVTGLSGPFYVILSHTDDWSAGGDPEGYGVDGGVDYPNQMYTMQDGVWASGDVLGYGGDYMNRALIEGPPGMQLLQHFADGTTSGSVVDAEGITCSSLGAYLEAAGIEGQEFSVPSSSPYPDMNTDTDIERDLTGYNIYRDNDMVAETWADTTYIDNNVPNGAYTYSVRAVYSSGISDAIYTDVIVDAPLIPDFSGDPMEGSAPLVVQFTDESIVFDAPLVAWYWDFGDGSSSNDQNPVHIYNDPGSFTVILMVLDLSGISATERKQDYINVMYEPGPGEFAVTFFATGGPTQITYDMSVGFMAGATDGYDPGYDQYAPPAPPPPAFDAAIGWGGDRYYVQILGVDVGNETVFDVLLQYAEDNLITLNWDNTGWSNLGTFFLTDAFDGALGINVDMTQENSLTLDNPAFNMLKLKITPSEGSVEPDIPEGFDYTATPASGVFQGQALIDGIPATADDWVAAYDGDGNCAGSQQLIINDGNAYINLTVYGDDTTTPDVDEGMNAGENFGLVLFDASENEFFGYAGSFDGWYDNNGAPMEGYDDPSVLHDFLTMASHEMDFMSNWNLMCVNVMLEDASPEVVFDELIADDNLVYVTGFGSGGVTFFDPSGPSFLNTLTSLDPGFGYWVKVVEADYTVAYGMTMPGNYAFDLMANWNLSAYWLENSQAPDVAFAEVIANDNLVYVTGFGPGGATFFDPYGLSFLNTLTSLDNGYGYWIKVNEAVEGFQYPPAMAGMAKAIVPEVNPDIHRTNKFMFVNGTISFDNIEYVIGDKVSVLTEGGLLVGEMELLEDNYLMTGAVYGDDITTAIIDGAIDGERLTFAYGEYVSDPVDIRFAGDMEPRNLSLKIRHIPEEYSLAQNYPNPFNPVTTINYNLPDEAQVTIVVYDLMGRIVNTLLNKEHTTAGYKSVVWNATDDRGTPVSAGLYFYQIHAGDFTQVRKMVLLK